MPQLKPSFVAKICEELERSKFTEYDFDIKLPDSGKMLVRIIFRYQPAWHLDYHEEERTDTFTVAQQFLGTTQTRHSKQLVRWIRASPGEVRTEAVHDVDDPASFLREIPKWCEAIRTDLAAGVKTPDPVAELRSRLQKELDGLIDDPDSSFSVEELSVVDARFDQLFNEIEALRSKYAIAESKLEELHSAFEEFKAAARTYPKGMWARLTTNKLVKATGSIINSPEGRTFLFQQLKKAIGFGSDA